MRVLLIFCIFIFKSCLLSAQSKLTDIDFVRKSAVPIKRMVDDVVILEPSATIKLGDSIVVVRFYDDNLEIIARAIVVGIQNRELLATTERESVVRLPTVKDFVIPVSALTEVMQEGSNPAPQDPVIPDSPPSYEPGYMDLSFGKNRGDYLTKGDSQVNAYKLYRYEFQETRFTWYFDFLWRLGFEYTSFKGEIPVHSYDRQIKTTHYSENKLAMLYRFLPVWRELRPTLRLLTINSNFETTNIDENIVSTKLSGFGLGMNWHYLFGDNLYVQRQRPMGWTLNKAYLNADFFSSLDVNDGGQISRGRGRGSRLDLMLGVTVLVYARALPLLKRYSFDIQYGQVSNKLSFSGLTKSAVDGFYSVPQGSTSSESESFLKISLGIRIDDVVSFLIKGRK